MNYHILFKIYLKQKKRLLKIIEIENVQDYEWANDWNTIVELFDMVNKLKELFNRLDVTRIFVK